MLANLVISSIRAALNTKDMVENQQWIRGKVFGVSRLSGKYYFYPVWWPGVWKTFCMTVKASQQHYRITININGQTVVQTEDIADNVLNSSQARI